MPPDGRERAQHTDPLCPGGCGAVALWKRQGDGFAWACGTTTYSFERGHHIDASPQARTRYHAWLLKNGLRDPFIVPWYTEPVRDFTAP